MMSDRELRIGNWVIDDSFGRGTYDQIDADWLLRFSEIPFDTMKPIPLTEEILMKCGHGKDGNMPSRLRLHSDFGAVLIPLKNPIALCKYLHQYQNLYFALTGEELIIDL